MPEPVLDAEVVSDEATFVPDVPLMPSPSGWCNDGDCPGCPGIFKPMKMPDPARKGTFYTLPAKRCPHVCHTRDLPLG